RAAGLDREHGLRVRDRDAGVVELDRESAHPSARQMSTGNVTASSGWISSVGMNSLSLITPVLPTAADGGGGGDAVEAGACAPVAGCETDDGVAGACAALPPPAGACGAFAGASAAGFAACGASCFCASCDDAVDSTPSVTATAKSRAMYMVASIAPASGRRFRCPSFQARATSLEITRDPEADVLACVGAVATRRHVQIRHGHAAPARAAHHVQLAGFRPERILDELHVLRDVGHVEVLDPLEDVVTHVADADGVRIERSGRRTDREAVIVGDEYRRQHVPRRDVGPVPGVIGRRPIGTPRIQESLFASREARGPFPLGLGRQPVAAAQWPHRGPDIVLLLVDRLEPVLDAEPVQILHRLFGRDADHRLVALVEGLAAELAGLVVRLERAEL